MNNESDQTERTICPPLIIAVHPFSSQSEFFL